MDKQSLNALLLKQLQSKFASTFFINGPPGAGKTHLLAELAKTLPSLLPSTQALGPYDSSKENLTVRILKDMFEYGYLSIPAPEECRDDWYGTWTWLKENLKVSGRQNFLILIRLNDNGFSQYEELRTWFSSLRYMEHYWNNNKIRLLLVVAGYWNHVLLEEHYKTIQLSFPYTTSTNYMVWNKIAPDETIDIVKRKFVNSRLPESLGNLIYEITGGLAGAIIDLLGFIESSNPSVSDIIVATRKAAEKGEHGTLLVESWRNYPATFIESIRQLLLYGKLRISDQSVLDLLKISGAVSVQEIFSESFVQLSSWYIELLLRNNAVVLGLANEGWKKVRFDEFAFGIASLNIEAYKVINRVESLIRNFALARLYEEDDGSAHVLQDKVLRRIKSTSINKDDDIYERAEEWRRNSKENGMNVSLNPLITFVSTGDLAQLVREIAVAGDPLWDDIVNAIEKISPIRNAVMHHQMIDEKNLESLYSLQAKVYTALNR